MPLIIIGALLIIFGLVDMIGSWAGFDLWFTLGVQLPEVVWQFSAYIELGLGYFLFKTGMSKRAAAAYEDADQVDGA